MSLPINDIMFCSLENFEISKVVKSIVLFMREMLKYWFITNSKV